MGWIEQDTTKLVNMTTEYCSDTSCDDCYFRKYTECLSQITYDLTTSVDRFNFTLKRCYNNIKENL